MTHQPQQLLVRVETKDRLPKKAGRYAVQISEDGVIWEADFNAEEKTWKIGLPSLAYTIQYWYEPATKIVLSVEEYEGIIGSSVLHKCDCENRDFVNLNICLNCNGVIH